MNTEAKELLADLTLDASPVSFAIPDDVADADLVFAACAETLAAKEAFDEMFLFFVALDREVESAAAPADAARILLGDAATEVVDTTATTPFLLLEMEPRSVETTEQDAEIFVGAAMC